MRLSSELDSSLDNDMGSAGHHLTFLAKSRPPIHPLLACLAVFVTLLSAATRNFGV